MALHPDDDELYQRLIPIYREHYIKKRKIYFTFERLWNLGIGMTAGEAMEQALGEAGLIDLPGERMKDGAEEYEEIMAEEKLLCTLIGKR